MSIITLLDRSSIGEDLDYSELAKAGELTVYDATEPSELAERLKDTEIAILNKIKMTREVLSAAGHLKLICVAATGYDNVDIGCCRERGIGVCNVAGYSTDSVAQITVSIALYLMSKIGIYNRFVTSGGYSASGKPNYLAVPYRELAGKTWGIIGYGNIGRKVAQIARAFGCRILSLKKHPDGSEGKTDLETLCRESDVISLHVPLNSETRSMIDESMIRLMKKDVILLNLARGAVIDESAVAKAVLDGRIGGFGCDVYSVEPYGTDHPYSSIEKLENVCLTPHIAWAAYEARVRCLTEIVANIRSFQNGIRRNRVD